jgi:hypothetical protein
VKNASSPAMKNTTLCSIACHVHDVFFTVNLKIDSNILFKKKTMVASNRASIQVTIRTVEKVKNKNKEGVGCKAASLEIKTVSTIPPASQLRLFTTVLLVGDAMGMMHCITRDSSTCIYI